MLYEVNIYNENPVIGKRLKYFGAQIHAPDLLQAVEKIGMKVVPGRILEIIPKEPKIEKPKVARVER